MQLTPNGNTHFKGAAKNLAKELKDQGFGITHSNALNITAVALGYKNYNTYIAQYEKIDSHPITATTYINEAREHTELLYPSIKERFVQFPHIKSDQLNIYIYKEENEAEGLYYLVVEIKDNNTGRVFYSPEYDAILLFVYPNIREGLNDYVIELHEINSEKLYQENFQTILHLVRSKNWVTLEVLEDIMTLMETLHIKRDNIRDVNKNIPKSQNFKNIFNENKDYL